MSPTSKTLHMKSEPELAGYQTRQVGNTCSFHAIAVSLRMLLDYALDPVALSEGVNRLWWRGRFMRVAPDWAVTPRMQVQIVHYLARTYSLPLSAAYQHGDPEILPEYLNDVTQIPVITLIWPWCQAPPIYLGSTSLNFNDTRSAGAHSMILAAHDPLHTNIGGQVITPWGFINPWKDNAAELFWMTDADFRRAWRFWLPGVGRNSLVLIERSTS